jgi:hypothetical protein
VSFLVDNDSGKESRAASAILNSLFPTVKGAKIRDFGAVCGIKERSDEG